VVHIARGLGHGSPVIALRTYAHLFEASDSAAAAAIENVFATATGTMIRACGANFRVAGVRQLLKVVGFLGRRRGRVAEGGGLLIRTEVEGGQ